MIAHVRQWWSTSHQLPLYSQHVRQGWLIASAPAARTHLSPLCDRRTCASGGARCIFLVVLATRAPGVELIIPALAAIAATASVVEYFALSAAVTAASAPVLKHGAPTVNAARASETSRRHTRRLLLRQQRRCGVTLADCCCGSKDVAASHSQIAVAAA